MVRLFLLLGLLALALTAACNSADPPAAPPLRPASGGTHQQVFQVKGVITGLNKDGKTVDIRHEAIPDYMPAMTMPFEARDPKALAGLRKGDSVSFRLTVTDTDSWIDEIHPLAAATPVEPPAPTAVRVVRDVNPLQIGDPLPEYHFTNELGQAISTAQFKGQAVAITFIFTRCPLPNFCPLMSNRFAETQKKLLALTNSPANWHLMTITFDPEFDTPVILKAYAERFGADPVRWNFLTGDPGEIMAIAEQFGEAFWRDQGALNHNLRTVVVDAKGRVQQVFQGNQWTSDELVAELVKALKR